MFLIKFANERLTKKHKFILRKLLTTQETSSALARNLSKELGCSRTCIFNSINSLKRYGLVEGGNGQAVRLTKSGLYISNALEVAK